MENPKLLNTNKTLLKVTPLAPFHELKVSCFPECASQTLEQFSSMPGYYLMDNPLEQGWQPNIEQNALQKISERVFSQELSEQSIPIESWPNVNDFNEFQRYFKVEQLALIADLGSEPLVTREVKL